MTGRFCYNCGKKQNYRQTEPVDDELKRTWKISQIQTDIFNQREGRICKSCGVNVRAQGLAKAILNSKFGYGATNLRDWVKKANANKLLVCELNSCHELHKTLEKLDDLTYAEYGTKSQQDIEQLTYKNDTFDLFLHSETLEHVNNPRLAMDETRRVIRPNGLVLFTTPIIWSRKTKRRAKNSKNKIRYIEEPSYHGKRTDDYLVFFEYGRDIGEFLGVDVCYADWINQNYVFVSNKFVSKMSAMTEYKLRTLEKVSQVRKVIT